MINMPTGKEMGQQATDNRSNQLNPNNPTYQGGANRHTGNADSFGKSAADNRSNQMNPNNPSYQGKK
ncbi:hypothetical protein FJT64_011107 [Amphibalanus amphitrite]|uniref:Uncharacterized protein n=1 Tax=Amphibalanus amphitrite TaxID=1232801 RepID=A0A6A4VN49_AMPAM|nr:hypothetical protein FJT64_011107 [Amphibalanus amphitrite]